MIGYAEVRKILSGIARAGERYGKRKVTQCSSGISTSFRQR